MSVYDRIRKNRVDVQDSNISKDRFQRLVEDIGHLVLKILGGH